MNHIIINFNQEIPKIKELWIVVLVLKVSYDAWEMLLKYLIKKEKIMASTFINRNIIYMNISVNGKQIKKSTGLLNTKENKQLVQKELLPKFIEEENDKIDNRKLIYYIDKFLDEKQHTLKSHTYHRYKLIINKYIRKEYGKYNVSEIKPSILKNYLNKQYNLGKSAKTVELYITVFSGILQEALYDNTIQNNPFKTIKKMKKEKVIITPFSPAEVRLLLEHSKGWLRNYIGIASQLGLRTGEMLGLKWEDITETHIKIRRTRDFNKDGTPKTLSSIRDLPLFENVIPFVESQRMITGDKYEYVFISYRKKPFASSGAVCQHHWYPLLDELGFKRRRIYELRHTFATNMLNSGFFKVSDIARLMGHTTTEYLFNVYSKYIESEQNNIPLNKNIY